MKVARPDEFDLAEDREKTGGARALEAAVRELIREVGENPEREGLLKTPSRVAESLRFLTRAAARSRPGRAKAARRDLHAVYPRATHG